MTPTERPTSGNRPEKVPVPVSIPVPPGYRDDARLDVYLTEHIRNATRAKVQHGIREGLVSVNGRTVLKSSYRVQAGDEIDCILIREPPVELRPEPIPLQIVFEDEHLIVLDKQAGMVVHPGYGNRTGTLVHALMHHVGAQRLVLDEDDDVDDDDIGLSTMNAVDDETGVRIIRPGIVHRLDKDTSGLLVVAKSDIVHARLAEQFAERTIYRRYEAVVWGVPDPSDGRIESNLGRDPRDRRRMASVDGGHGKRAVTHYRLLNSFVNTSHLEFRLETGRTHQIRIHARDIGHPIFGDTTYGGDRILKGSVSGARKAYFNRLFDRLPRQALHASALGFTHPATGEDVRFHSPLPSDVADVIESLRTHDTA